jgi:hypothetical protein
MHATSFKQGASRHTVLMWNDLITKWIIVIDEMWQDLQNRTQMTVFHTMSPTFTTNIHGPTKSTTHDFDIEHPRCSCMPSHSIGPNCACRVWQITSVHLCCAAAKKCPELVKNAIVLTDNDTTHSE